MESAKPTALRFTGVTTVLSSVFSHVLSCSLTSESKQEALHRADTAPQILRKGQNSPGICREPTGSFLSLCLIISGDVTGKGLSSLNLDCLQDE